MRLISNEAELRKNMDTLDSYLKKQTEPNHEYAIELIKKGICFVAVKEKGAYGFYPSRFIGYLGNTREAHINNDERDGTVTNPAISAILGAKPLLNPELEVQYRKYCEHLGFSANNRGLFGAERKYWEL
jgi:hypothetical protein